MSAGAANYRVSTDPEKLDVGFVCRMLATTYWAPERPRRVVEASIKGSLCFGVYAEPGGGQVGFARVVTDGATFSWVCDVVIDEAHRGKGLGKLLMASIVAEPRLQGTVFLLRTLDAHGLYEKFGFERTEMMRKGPPIGVPKPRKDPPQK